MNGEEFVGSVEFSVSVALAPWDDPGHFVQTIKGTAIDLEENPSGDIRCQLVSTTEAINHGWRLLHVFENGSPILEAVYSTLFDAREELREEFDIPTWSNLLFVESVSCDERFEQTSLRVQLIETTLASFCPDGLALAIEDELQLSGEEWRRLGFRRIAGARFVIRDQSRTNPYEQPLECLQESSYVCNSCGEEIVVPIDVTQGSVQSYVEDCPICCRPNVIHVEIDEDGDPIVWAEPE